jgi:hypothetical protein
MSQHTPPFTHGDPLTVLLMGRFRISPWAVAAGWFLIVNIPVVVIASIEGLWLNQSDQIGLLNDFSWWLWQISSVPATFIFFLWMPKGLQSVLERLKNNGVFIIPEPTPGQEDKYDAFIAKFDRAYSHWAWAAICLLLILAYTFIFSLPSSQVYKTWFTSEQYIYSFYEITWAINFFLVILIVVRVVVAIVWINRLFREFQVKVVYLHPDGAGGMSPLGEFIVREGYLIGVYGLAFVVALFTESYFLSGRFTGLALSISHIVGAVVYVVIAPVVFFTPMMTAHSIMKKSRDSFLLEIARQFETDIPIQASLDLGANELEQNVDKLDQLQRLHKIVSDFPVWPVNLRSFISFFSSVLFPLLLGLIPIAIDLMVR